MVGKYKLCTFGASLERECDKCDHTTQPTMTPLGPGDSLDHPVTSVVLIVEDISGHSEAQREIDVRAYNSNQRELTIQKLVGSISIS